MRGVRSRTSTKTYLGALIVLATLLLGWALRLHRLGARSLQYEEGYAVHIASLNTAETLLWSSRDLVPPLQSFLLTNWMTLAGQSEFAARFVSVAAGILTVAVLVRFAKQQSMLAGLLAGLLAALSPFYVWHSQHARMYALLAFFGTAATLCLSFILHDPSRKRLWIAFAVLESLALYTHTSAVFLLLFHALSIALAGVWSEDQAFWKYGSIACGTAILAWLPWVLYAIPFLGRNAGYWPGRLSALLVVFQTFQAFVGGQLMGPEVSSIAMVLGCLGCLLGLGALALRREWSRALLLLGWMIVPVVLLIVIFRRLPKFEPRYLILASPPVILLLASGASASLHWLGARILIRAIFVAMVALFVIGLGNLYFVPEFSGPDFRAAAQLVEAQSSPDELVVLLPGYAFPVWGYYYNGEWEALPDDDPVLDVRNVLHYSNVVVHLNEWLDNYSGVWLVQWDPEIVDPTGITQYMIERVADKTPVTGPPPNGVSVDHYRFTGEQRSLPTNPEVTAPQPYVLGLPLRLYGCDIDRDDAAVDVACYWQASGELPEQLAISVRLFDESDNLLTAEDGPLIVGRWPGVPVLDRHLLPCDGSCPPAPYWLTLAVYDYNGREYGVAIVGPLDLQ